ncbi:saccharopine dehydrogenase NADP-binding domain-containing protein [Nonomuraea sp. NPDC049758]|uniref:saccharopine dehydrogenase NADP-binding domain-containing protein n=1 Tax=Nonomuraea sp. NPDC049758 TaxID=3154360 RepID=UPI00343D05F0
MSGILVIGGYGAVGGQVSAVLDEWFPGRVTAAGRAPDRARLPAGVRRVRLDLADVAALERLLDAGSIGVVVLCVEPADAAVAEVCLSRGVHLVDVGASDHLLRQVEGLADRAVAGGATAVLSVGVAPGLTNLLARRAYERVGGARRVDLTVLLGAGERHGADAVAWTVGRLAQPATGRPRRCDLPGHGRRTAHPLDFSDQHSLRRTLGGGPEVVTRVCFDSAFATGLLFGLRRIGVFRAARSPLARRLVAATLSRVHVGSDDFAVRADAADGERHAALALTGNSQSRITAVVAAHVVRAVVGGVLPAGVHHIDLLPALAGLPEELAPHGVRLYDLL